MNRSRLRRLLVLCTLALVAACDDATGPNATPSEATVHAYVDTDGSGTISQGDVFLSGIAIELENTETGATLTADTDAFGVAHFAAVPPGSYRVTMAGTTPAGAVLATASTPILVAPFEGGTIAQEFRFVYQAGGITGRIYRDDNANGEYDPGIDTPAPGIPVTLFAGADATGDALAETNTDEDGLFRFTTLRPGTYTYVVEPLPTMDLPDGDTVTVNVGAAAPTEVEVEFTGNLISSIADAKLEATGTAVAVEGVVTVAPGTFRPAGDNMYIQDATSGIQVFNVPAGAGIELGDSVRVIGVMAVFNDEQQIARASSTSPLIVTVIGPGTVPAPRPVSGADLDALRYEGELVTVNVAEVVAVGSVSGTTGAYSVDMQAPTGETFQVRIEHSNVGIPASFWVVGSQYNVTGAHGQFRGTAQVKPRSPADVEPAPAPMTIAAARAAAIGDTVTVEGVVIVSQGTFNAANVYIQDATRGIQVFNVPTSMGLDVGDSIRVTGLMAQFSQERQIARFSSTRPPVVTLLGTGTVPAPRPLTAAQVLANTYEGELASVSDVEVLSVGTVSGSTGGYNVTVRGADNTTFTVRVERSSVGIASTFWVVGSHYDVTGVLGSFNGSGQLKPRSAADVTAR